MVRSQKLSLADIVCSLLRYNAEAKLGVPLCMLNRVLSAYFFVNVSVW